MHANNCIHLHLKKKKKLLTVIPVMEKAEIGRKKEQNIWELGVVSFILRSSFDY